MSRLKSLYRLLMLNPRHLRYLWLIRRSNLFDRDFYLDANPRVHWLFRRFPERHYILMGEEAGLYPNPDFSPVAYLRHNHDVAKSGQRPFEHFLRAGRHEQRVTREHSATIAESGSAVAPLRGAGINQNTQAVVIHLYYTDLWDEFRDRLRSARFAFDLYVTLTEQGPETEETRARIAEDWPEARVLVLPNRGRDIYPFLHLLNAGWLDHYRAVCKLHSKKSPHRQDGDVWRTHLTEGILPEGETAELLERFLAAEDCGLWVADGQHYEGARWWGSNLERCRNLLARLELTASADTLDFPAGSIYWLKPAILDMLRGLALGFDDFDIEQGQTDGTLAHALERALGMICAAGGLQILQTTQLRDLQPAPSRPAPHYVSAFYLPQFHPVPENDAWWGKGFTEWTAVSRAQAQFDHHAQPALPADLGFYDLRLTQVMGEQAALARAAGIDAFCVYHYWFDGNRLLEQPIDRLLEQADIDFPFYLCWANESWRRNWDGLSGEVLMDQSYAPGFASQLARSLIPYFNDPRYQRPDGTRPRFVIYRPEDMPDPAAAVAEMRALWRTEGIGEVELGAVLFHVEGAHPVAEDLFDFWVEMPPHGIVTQDDDYLYGGARGNRMPVEVPGYFGGVIYDYDRVRARSQDPAYAGQLPAHTIAGTMPSWDNTARRGSAAHMAWGANPIRFERWLRELRTHRLQQSYRGEIMINAWNEWAEKAVLEPSAQHGRGYLNALRRGLGPKVDQS